MITLDDCIDFCELPPTLVEKIAAEQNIPIVMACAVAHGRTISANDDHQPAPCSPNPLRLVA